MDRKERRQLGPRTDSRMVELRALPLAEPVWARVVAELGFAPQEARIVEGILKGQRDKQIARDLGLKMPTVRTYLTRAFRRCGASDRVELVVRVFTVARDRLAD